MNAIETAQLTRHFDGRPAVDSLNLTIPQGAVFGFLGPNGAGKTTTVRMLTALIAPTAGSARILGEDVVQHAQHVRRSVGMLTETPGLYDRLSAADNLRFFGELYGLTAKQASERTTHYLKLFDLASRANDSVGGFSKGMRQKVAIARALLHDPAVVFLDEPTSGLDPEAARVVRTVIRDIHREGRTIFLTTHNLAEAEELCTLIGIFRTRLLRLDTPDRLRTDGAGTTILVRVTGEAARWEQPTRALACVQQVSASADTLTITLADEHQNPALIRALVAAGAEIRFVEPSERTLESAYLELIQGF